MPAPQPTKAGLLQSSTTSAAVIAIPGTDSTSSSRRHAKNPAANLSAYVIGNPALSKAPIAAITVSMKKGNRLLGLSLQGHKAPVADLEFLATDVSAPVHVLGSCDQDGTSENGTMVLVPNDGSNIRVVTFHCEPADDPGGKPNTPIIAPPPAVKTLPAPEEDDVPPAPEPPLTHVTPEHSQHDDMARTARRLHDHNPTPPDEEITSSEFVDAVSTIVPPAPNPPEDAHSPVTEYEGTPSAEHVQDQHATQDSIHSHNVAGRADYSNVEDEQERSDIAEDADDDHLDLVGGNHTYDTLEHNDIDDVSEDNDHDDVSEDVDVDDDASEDNDDDDISEDNDDDDVSEDNDDDDGWDHKDDDDEFERNTDGYVVGHHGVES